MPETLVRTVQRGYRASTGRRGSRVRRVHVVREEGPARWDASDGKKQTMCGQHAWDVQDSPALIRDVPHPLPDGLSWCPSCIGHLAEHLGQLGDVARMLGVAP